MWSFYEEASVFGKEVHTTGGSRGPSRAFFVPSLSAMQLFVPDSGSQPSGTVHTLSDAAAAQVCNYDTSLSAWQLTNYWLSDLYFRLPSLVLASLQESACCIYKQAIHGIYVCAASHMAEVHAAPEGDV